MIYLIIKGKVLGEFRLQKSFIFIKDDKHFWTYPRELRNWVLGLVIRIEKSWKRRSPWRDGKWESDRKSLSEKFPMWIAMCLFLIVLNEIHCLLQTLQSATPSSHGNRAVVEGGIWDGWVIRNSAGTEWQA